MEGFALHIGAVVCFNVVNGIQYGYCEGTSRLIAERAE